MKKALILLISTTMLFCTGCGKDYTTLEDYVNSTEETRREFKKMESDEGDYIIDVTAEKNNLIYGIQYKNQLSDTEVETLIPELEMSYAQSGNQFEDMVVSLEEVTNIDGIQIIIVVCNSDGTQLWSTTYINEENVTQ